jgi:pimeloyl-ACP methyl ester carboxylesterase
MSFLVSRPRNQYPADAFSNLNDHFCLANARASMWLSQLAYESDAGKIESILGDWDLKQVLTFAPAKTVFPFETQTNGFVLTGRGRAFIAFAGTDPLKFVDWMTDLLVEPNAEGLYSGFVRGLECVWPDIQSFLRTQSPGCPLWVVGHSLGAAIASLCAWRAHQDLNVNIEGAYVFGMPRVGGTDFVRQYELALGSQTFRFVHGQDVVPSVPPSELGYRHVGRRLSCASFGLFNPDQLAQQLDDEPAFPPRIVSGIHALLQQILSGSVGPLVREDPLGLAFSLLPPAVGDHIPERYCRATSLTKNTEALMNGDPNLESQPVFDQDVFDAARADREGQAWWLNEISPEGLVEGAPIHSPPSNTPISVRAFDMIVEFEVSSEALYTSRYRRPVWPKKASGVTIGIGYDVGYEPIAQLHQDWDGAIPAPMVKALEAALGVTGTPADAVAANLRNSVDVPWDAAISVHRSKVIPRWVGLVEGRLPNTNLLSADSLGALVSLTYNRGASFDNPDDRYTEMRAIKADMIAKAFGKIPDELRSMKRLWPDVPGLQDRREKEAKLFELGLA